MEFCGQTCALRKLPTKIQGGPAKNQGAGSSLVQADSGWAYAESGREDADSGLRTPAKLDGTTVCGRHIYVGNYLQYLSLLYISQLV